MYKAYLILLLLILFGSIISSPAFIKNSQQGGLHFVYMALADDSSDDSNSNSEDDSSKDQTDDSSKDQTDDSSKDQTDDSSKSGGVECVNTDVSDENSGGANDKSQPKSCDETDKTTDKTDEKTTDKTDEKADESEGTKADVNEVKEHTVLDEILSDDTLIKEVVNDETTEPSLASALLVLQEEQVPDTTLTETCGNQADDNGDGTIDEGCTPVTTQPTETCGNQVDDDGDGTIDEEECVVPPTETCGNQVDDDGDGTIDEEECVVPPTEICDNGSDDDHDGKTDTADKEDCPAVVPTVAIEAAEDANGDTLSPGDLITPGEVSFTFSAQASETTNSENSQEYKFECAVDDESFNSCSSPETVKMDDGKHTFVVRLAS